MKEYHKIETIFERDMEGNKKLIEGNPLVEYLKNREDIEEIAKSFSMKCVPMVLVKTITEAVEYVKSKPLSQVGKCIKEIEGVVGVPKCRINDFRGNRVIVKIKVEDFN